MYAFLAGLIAGLAGGCLVLYFVLIKINRNSRAGDEKSRQIEQLARLTGSLAHEIKNPLSTIKVNLKLVSEDVDRMQQGESVSGRVKRKLSVIAGESERLEQILDGFLRYVGKIELTPVSMDINFLLSDMVDFYTPQAQSHGITMRFSPCDKPLVCKIDVDMLKQTILNLFINAQQAVNEGGEIIVTAGRDKNWAIIRISDTGQGIAKAGLGRIFDAYYSTKARGSGLGLPMVKKVVEAHNGMITVDSEPGRGTGFTIKLALSEA
jgi:signal transduction histidine kinase